MHAPLTVKVMNEAASSSHARRADGRGASAFIVSDTSRLRLFHPGLLDDGGARACLPVSHHRPFGNSIGGGGHSAFLSAAAIISSTVPAARMIFPWPTKPDRKSKRLNSRHV